MNTTITTTNSTGGEALHANCDIITIIRDPAHVLGKEFKALPGNQVDKKSTVSVALGIAEQRHVPDVTAMAALLEEVSEDPHAALINASFKDIPVGVPFVILSKKQMEERGLGKTREEQKGVKAVNIEVAGETYEIAIGRLKENVLPSSWQLFDRDVDAHTPPQFGEALDHFGWLVELNKIVPGILNAARVRTGSTSARVRRGGKPVGGGNGHTWVQVQAAGDVVRARIAMLAQAAKQGLTWRKPKFSKKTGERIGMGALTTVIDISVWTPGRLIFSGRPVASNGLTVAPQSIEIENRDGPRLDTALIESITGAEFSLVTEKAGVLMSIRESGDSLAVDAYDLTMDTELELEDGRTITVHEALGELDADGKLRCQAPFRDSQSFAGVFRIGKDSRPSVHDVGTTITHWLSNDEFIALDFDDLIEQEQKARADAREEVRTLVAHGDIAYHPDDLKRKIEALLPVAAFAREECAKLFERLAATMGEPVETLQQALGQAARPRFAAVPLTELMNAPPTQWFIKGVLPKADVAVAYGESGAGKSFMVLDMMLAIARGVPSWRNHRVKLARVVYVCAEGKAGLGARLSAYREHYGVELDGLPFRPIIDVPNFLKEDDIQLAKQIKADGGADIVVIDTLAQTTPGGDENGSEDMGKALAHCRRLGVATGALVMLVHHAGKDLNKGARGWSGLKAAADVELSIEKGKEGLRSLRVTKLKDGQGDAEYPFRLLQVDLGVDADGDPINSCVIGHADETPNQIEKPRGKNQQLALRIVQDLTGLGDGYPTKDEVIAALEVQMKPPENGKDQRKQIAKIALEKLVEQGKLAEVDGCLAIANATKATNC